MGGGIIRRSGKIVTQFERMLGYTAVRRLPTSGGMWRALRANRLTRQRQV